MITVKEIESASELEIAFQIRKKVFVEEQNVPLEEEYDEFETTSTHFLALLNKVPAGTARMRKTEKGIKLERFAVLKEYRKKDVGTALVKNLLTKCKNELDCCVYLYAQLTALKFYERFGFEAKGKTFLDAGIYHLEMEYLEKRESK